MAKPRAGILLLLVVLATGGLLVTPANGGGVGQTCVNRATADGQLDVVEIELGASLLYVPYLWCRQNCGGSASFGLDFMLFFVVQFILPAIIFALVVPRRWHLDFPARMFHLGPNRLANVGRLVFSTLAVGPVAFADMVIWVTVILTLSGPMMFSGLLEMYLDVKTVAALRHARDAPEDFQLSPYERLDILVSLLCGNFAGTAVDATQAVRDVFSPLPPTNAPIPHTKSRLLSILTSQTTFGFSMGVGTLFFLGGFLYSSLTVVDLTATGQGATPYAIWLMVIIYVAMISATCLTGSNPTAVNVLLNPQQQPGSQTRWLLIVDYYKDELYPTSMLERGVSKLGWLMHSEPCRTKSWFAEKLKPGITSWIGIYLLAVALAVFPGVIAHEITYNIPIRADGCRSLSYILYCGSQAWLTTVAAKWTVSGLSYAHFPIAGASKKYDSTWQIATRVALYSLAAAMTAIAVLLSFAIAFFGTIFQISGVYGNCLCQTYVSTWLRPASDRKTLIDTNLTDAYIAQFSGYIIAITLASAGVTAVLCYFSWWYQKVLRRAVATEIENL